MPIIAKVIEWYNKKTKLLNNSNCDEDIQYFSKASAIEYKYVFNNKAVTLNDLERYEKAMLSNETSSASSNKYESKKLQLYHSDKIGKHQEDSNHQWINVNTPSTEAGSASFLGENDLSRSDPSVTFSGEGEQLFIIPEN